MATHLRCLFTTVAWSTMFLAISIVWYDNVRCLRAKREWQTTGRWSETAFKVHYTC